MVKCFAKEFMDDAEFMIAFFRNHPRLHALLKVLGENLALLRVVDTRFLTHVTARLVKAALEVMCKSESFLQYKKGLTKRQKVNMEHLANALDPTKFVDVFIAKKQLIFTTFVKSRQAAHRSVFDAAFILETSREYGIVS